MTLPEPSLCFASFFSLSEEAFGIQVEKIACESLSEVLCVKEKVLRIALNTEETFLWWIDFMLWFIKCLSCIHKELIVLKILSRYPKRES